MQSKVALVTGGSRGLGFATAQKLAGEGYRVVITARTRDDSERAAAKIRAAVPGATVDPWTVDLSSPPSVRALADRFLATKLPLHLLVNNAGIMARAEREVNADGLEMQFATNHLGHFLLTRLLTDRLIASKPARIVVVSSVMHIEGVGPGLGPKFEFDNLDAHRDYDGMRFYRNSKLANMWFTYALARRLEGAGVTVNAVCPGFVPSTAVEFTKGFQYLLFRYVFPWLPQARTVDQASTHMAWVATSPALDGVSGRFYTDSTERRSSDPSYDEGQQERLWVESERLLGLQDRAAATRGAATA